MLKLKIPPPIVALVTAALMWVTARATPTLGFALPGNRVVACALAVAGVTCAISGVIAFRRVGTTVNPLVPEKASSLVVSGIFRVTRNPMYLGLLLVLTGWAIYLSNALGCVLLPVFVLYMNRFQIGPEESALAAKFGDEFVAYKSRVRRWV